MKCPLCEDCGWACEGHPGRPRECEHACPRASGRSCFLLSRWKVKQMSIIPKLLSLGLATALGSTVPQHQIDFSMPGPDGQRINQLWLVTYLNEAGLEVVAQAKLQSGDYAPLIAADLTRLESMMPAARDLATTRNIKMRLIKFTNRVDIEDIVP
jgi:hypothetical protein